MRSRESGRSGTFQRTRRFASIVSTSTLTFPSSVAKANSAILSKSNSQSTTRPHLSTLTGAPRCLVLRPSMTSFGFTTRPWPPTWSSKISATIWTKKTWWCMRDFSTSKCLTGRMLSLWYRFSQVASSARACITLTSMMRRTTLVFR